MRQDSIAIDVAHASRRQPGLVGWLLLAPLLAWLVAFVVAPAAILAVYSVSHRGTLGGVVLGFSLDAYARALEPTYLWIAARSVAYAAITTAICAVLAYPVAWTIGRAREGRRDL